MDTIICLLGRIALLNLENILYFLFDMPTLRLLHHHALPRSHDDQLDATRTYMRVDG